MTCNCWCVVCTKLSTDFVVTFRTDFASYAARCKWTPRNPRCCQHGMRKWSIVSRQVGAVGSSDRRLVLLCDFFWDR